MQRRPAIVSVAIGESDDAHMKPVQGIHGMSSAPKEHSDLPRQGVGMALENNSRPAALAWAVHTVGAVVVVMVFVWSLAYRGGVAWTTENKALIFNVII